MLLFLLLSMSPPQTGSNQTKRHLVVLFEVHWIPHLECHKLQVTALGFENVITINFYMLHCKKCRDQYLGCAPFEHRFSFRKSLANQMRQNLISIDIGHNSVNKRRWTICIFYIMSPLCMQLTIFLPVWSCPLVKIEEITTYFNVTNIPFLYNLLIVCVLVGLYCILCT